MAQNNEIHEAMKRAARHNKAGDYRKARQALLDYRGHDTVDKALAQLDAKLAEQHKEQNKALNIFLAGLVLVVTAIIAGSIGYAVGMRQVARPPDEAANLGPDLENVFVEACVGETSLSPTDCRNLINASWLWFRKDTLECLGNAVEIRSYTRLDLLQCVNDLLDRL